MDRVKLVYARDDGNDIELPFRALVMGDFTQRWEQQLSGVIKPIAVTLANLDEVFTELDVRFEGTIDYVLEESEQKALSLDLAFSGMSDFTPDGLCQAVPELARLVDLRDRISTARDTAPLYSLDTTALPEEHKAFLSHFKFPSALSQTMCDAAIVCVDERLKARLDAIYANDEFRQLESAWRGLHYLLTQLKPQENCRIDILPISKSALMDDFENTPDVYGSFLAEVVYTAEFGQYGGKPYAVMIGNYEFNQDVADINLLRNLGSVASISHAPFISGVDPKLFYLDDFSELATLSNLSGLVAEDPHYLRWRRLQAREESRYIGLCLPRMLLRHAYDFQADNIQSFPYRQESRPLWGNPAFGFCACLIRSFANYRWCLNIVGKQGGLVHGLPKARGPQADSFIPTDIKLSEAKESELIGSGFIPLVVQANDGTATYFSAPSIQQHEAIPKKQDQVVSYMLGAQLPYLFIVSRLAHYLKAIQRDNLGSNKNHLQIQTELNKWLVQYVSDMDNPAPAVRARRPLRHAKLVVSDQRDASGSHAMQLTVIPHMKYMGIAFSLSLKGKLA